MSSRKNSSFDKLAVELTGDESILQDVERHEKATRIVSLLENERVRQKLTQKEIAQRMGVSESTISRFEDTPDEDLRLGDVKSYMRALGMSMSMLICEEALPSAARIKHYVIEIQRLLTKLTEYAKNSHGDQELCDAISKFQGEVLFNFLIKYVQSGADPSSFFVEMIPQKEDVSLSKVKTRTNSSGKVLAV
jgi:transcriptional regulator with XRE-family HTH domain